MNPFLLTGLHFLIFYFLFGSSLLTLFRWWMISGASKGKYRAIHMASDPYRIAYLRAGPEEAVKIATISLIDRGLLSIKNRNLWTNNRDALNFIQRPIEKFILKRYATQCLVDPLLHRSMNSVWSQYDVDLLRHGLLPDETEKLQRWIFVLLIAASLVTITFIKIDIAFSQGRHNVIFLVLLTTFFCVLLLGMASRRTSARGALLLSDLKILFDRLKKRAHLISAGGATNEAALLAAVYGLSLLPAMTFSFVSELYPVNPSGSSNDSSSGDGGGCGGGCGGCGG